MPKIEAKDYLGQVAIPEAKKGSYAIEHFKHPANDPLELSSLRTSIVGGQKHGAIMFDHETTWHRLVYDGGVWMTDLPIEQQQHRDCLKRFKGHVLVGGLGLGLAVNWLASRRNVKSVTVVEISPEVITLVSPYIRDPRGIVKVVKGDLLKWLETEGESRKFEKFDWAFYDIWQGDGQTNFFDTVCPLRANSQGLVHDRRVICWNEDVMRGQLFMGLQSRYVTANVTPEPGSNFKPCSIADLAHPKVDTIWLKWSAPFFQQVEEGNVNDGNVQMLAGWYAQEYGRPDFEKLWPGVAKHMGALRNSLKNSKVTT